MSMVWRSSARMTPPNRPRGAVTSLITMGGHADHANTWRPGLYGLAWLSRGAAGLQLVTRPLDPLSSAQEAERIVPAPAASTVAVLELSPSGHWHSAVPLNLDTSRWLATQHPQLRRVERIPERFEAAAQDAQ
jgi:hypothetical protein